MYEDRYAKRVIFSILGAREWSERRLAKLTGISPSTISRHLSGQRPIEIKHLNKYLDALDRHEQAQLFLAWLQDRVGILRVTELVKASGGDVKLDLGPSVDPDKAEILAWWARETSRDGEMDELFRGISQRFGYKRKRRRA